MSPTRARLELLFGAIVVACGGATDDGSAGTSARALCGSGRLPPFPAGLTATPLQDFVAARSETAFLGAASEADGFVMRTNDPTGEPCKNARDVTACRTRLDTLRVLPTTRKDCESKYPNVLHPAGILPGCRVSYLVFTRGDEVGVAVENSEVRSLIGTFDTVQEADWLLSQSYEPTCGGSKGQGFTVRTVDGGFEFAFVNNCERSSVVTTVLIGHDGTTTELPARRAPEGTEFSCSVAGRRTDGVKPAERRCSWLAATAALEAEAVIAFRRLGRELAMHDAPRDLRRRVRAAIRDEVRHTRAMNALAGRMKAVSIERRALPLRDLEAVAIENAREGCVREAFGAIQACHQATFAEDREVRAVLGPIAVDETAHAALALDVAAWLDEKLTDPERARVHRARQDALADLRDELATVIQDRALGLPRGEHAVAMLDAYCAAQGWSVRSSLTAA